MLKIAKYNKITGEKVDLKELEKFSFKPKYDEDTGKIYKYIYEYEFCGTKKVVIEIQKDFYSCGKVTDNLFASFLLYNKKSG